MKNCEKYAKEIAHDILCALSESGSDVAEVLPESMAYFCDFDPSYDSDEVTNLANWLLSEADNN